MPELIDMSRWPRREIYDFFAPMADPFYALTFPVEVTRLRAHCRERGLPFYPALVFGVTKAMESVDAFLYKDRGGALVKHERLVPSFTDLDRGGELFRIVTLEAGDDLEDFCRRAKEKSAAQREFITSGPWDEDSLIYFSCLPWFPVSAFKNERDTDPKDSVPRVTWGRCRVEGGRTLLDMSLELNHRLLDGVHVGKFYEALTRWMEGI